MSIVGWLWALLQVILRSRLRETLLFPHREKGTTEAQSHFSRFHLHLFGQRHLQGHANSKGGQNPITLPYALKDKTQNIWDLS